MKKSMIEVAYEIVSASETPLSFQNLWKQVVEQQEFTTKQIEDNISRFYSQLGIDGRFCSRASRNACSPFIPQ